MKQLTIKTSITLSGIGVHSGKTCEIIIESADPNTGIIFIAEPHDNENSIVIANYNNVSDTRMCTRISNNFGVTISVVEHISAAFYALGITNAVVKLRNSTEIPFLDGSALPFTTAILKAGIQEQNAKKKQIQILKKVKIGDSERWASLSPADHFIIRIDCDYTKKGLNTIPFQYDSFSDNFKNDIAGARTFGFFSEVEYLRKNNLAIGASMKNTVVFNDKGEALNPEGLRYSNEPIRHKILDIIGDLSLSQCEIIGRYDAFCPGHNLNNLLLRELFKDSNNFRLI
ncbi:MAG: UDP-3-O-[Alphaproteobacteria bacterium]|nr:UDP-3-O-[3-hydroxymyristoyl] N-acetylglucosamine deacetylase [Alphaproteobacteria bacterium]